MFNNLKLSTKLLAIGISLCAIPLSVICLIILQQNKKMVNMAGEESTKLAFSDLDHIAKGVYAMCSAQQESIQQYVNHSLNVAKEVLFDAGSIGFSEEKTSWDVSDQYTKRSYSVELPKMMVGDTWLDKNYDAEESSSIVDKVESLVGCNCTIFQRMNTAGDMLRVSTSVRKKNGTRAIGTFIPAINPDGKSDPIISAVLNRQTFTGRSYVIDKWYITAYMPLLRENKEVAGMLCAAIPQENVTTLRQAIMDTKVGETGYVYVVDSSGNYIISDNGKRDGENIWQAKDSNGDLFIQEICKKALALRTGEIAEQWYPWKNTGDSVARTKVVRIMYFEPWDWVIGVGSYIDEFYEAKNRINATGKTSNMILGCISGVTLLASIVIWFFVARAITGKINKTVSRLTEASAQVAAASNQVASASQSLAEGATEQAAGLEETSSSIEETASMTKQNAENAQQADILAREARDSADGGNEAMAKMNDAISAIEKSAGETAKIIKVIDDIAFQTNLLALNAAVEAARAGEAGKGFAVVAEEVRNLAMRSAEAAKNTTTMIDESVKNAQNGVKIADEVTKVLEGITTSSGKVNDLVSEISAACQEQSQGIDQINTAISQIDKVTQQNAANAEESASASKELNAQAEEMSTVVDDLASLVGGSSSDRESRSKKTRKSETTNRHNRLSKSDRLFHNISEDNSHQKNSTAAAKSAVGIQTADYTDDDEFKEWNS